MLVGDIPRRNADRWPDREAIVDATVAGEGTRLSHTAWNAQINTVADALAQRGVGVGDRVALHTYNSLPEVTVMLAASKLGAVSVPTNHRLAAGELAHVLDLSGCDLLIYDPDLETTVVEAGVDAHRVATADVSRRDEPPDVADEHYADLLEGGKPIEPDRPSIAPTALNVLMHTSGTTGRPKLVEVDHRGQWMNAMSNVAELRYRHADRALNLAPLYHSAGYFNNFLPALQVGATNVIVADFDPERTLGLLDEESITSFLGVPTHFQRFRTADLDTPAVDDLRFVVTSGATLSAPTVEWVREHLTERFVNVYGLTESTGLVTMLGPEDFDRMDQGYCIGEPFHGVDVRVVEPTDDATADDVVDSASRGQLICRSHKTMPGYHGQPERTADALRDGWLFTGDVVVRDDDGFVYLIDRMDNQIVTGGENVYPAEVEQVLDTAPGVEESAVVGEPDPEWGEKVVAYVVREDDSLSATDLDEFWDDQTRLAGFKRPRDVRFVDHVPKNPSGKILREELG